MELSKKLKENKNTVMLTALVLVVFIGFWFLSRGKEPLVSVSVRVPSQEIIGRELIIELERLKSLNQIDSNFFNDPVFRRLRDNEVRPAIQPVGRNNPFVPQSFE